MNILQTVKSIGLGLVTFGATSLAAKGAPATTHINPALTYYQAFLLAPELTPADDEYFTNQWQGQVLPARFGPLVAQYDNEFKLVRLAAESRVSCDWGIDLKEGPATLLPHLARSKAVAIATRLRVQWQLQHAHEAEAADEWLAAMVLGRNISRDGTLIANLVQLANEMIDCSTLAANFRRFSPETLKQLIDRLDAAPPRRAVAETLPTEKALFLDHTWRKVVQLREQNPGNDAKVMEGIRQMFQVEDAAEDDANIWENLAQAAGGTSEGVLKLLREREQLYTQTAKLVSLPYADFERRAGAFTDQAKASPNPFIRETIPAFLNARQKEFRVLACLAMVRAAVEYKLHGEAGLESIKDPCGNGPLAFRRFVFGGVDRGFELKSRFNLGNNKAVLIFVEKDGPPFRIDGNYPGQPLVAPTIDQ